MSGIDGFNCMHENLCVPQERVCDGYPDCVMGTTVFDEMNCIPESGTQGCKNMHPLNTSQIKGLALAIRKHHHTRTHAHKCGFYVIHLLLTLHNIIVGCIHGNVRTPLLGGVADTEGLVEVCVNGTYYTVSLDNGRFSVREVTVICKQLRLGNGKFI